MHHPHNFHQTLIPELQDTTEPTQQVFWSVYASLPIIQNPDNQLATKSSTSPSGGGLVNTVWESCSFFSSFHVLRLNQVKASDLQNLISSRNKWRVDSRIELHSPPQVPQYNPMQHHSPLILIFEALQCMLQLMQLPSMSIPDADHLSA